MADDIDNDNDKAEIKLKQSIIVSYCYPLETRIIVQQFFLYYQ